MKSPANPVIPVDIINRISQDFPITTEQVEALNIIQQISETNLNVGWQQLSRAIIIIANGKIEKMNEIVKSNYYGDPRDVIMSLMALPENDNDYGLKPFM